MDKEKLKKKIFEWSESIGRADAQRILINKGLSFSLAYQLSTHAYHSEPKERVVMILEEILIGHYK
jgi:hypothetical protein